MIDINSFFKNCKTLLSLPNISKLKINYVKNMNSLFCGCSSLLSLGGVTNWKTNNVNNINNFQYKEENFFKNFNFSISTKNVMSYFQVVN